MKKLLLVVVMVLLAPSVLKAGVRDRLYDFTDAYYLQNGINPAAIAWAAPARTTRGDGYAEFSVPTKRSRIADFA